MKKHNNLLKGLLTLILFSSSYFLYAQYPAVSHSAAAPKSAPCEFASISTVIIEDVENTELYKKLDFCSGTKATNYHSLFGASGPPVASLSQCGTYTLKINCTTTSGRNHTVASVGVWADFNNDKDFDDPGEWLSGPSWSVSPGVPGTGVVNGSFGGRPDNTRSLTFNVPGNAASSFVIRIRSAEYTNTITQKSAGGNLTDGETEDFLVRAIPSSPPKANFFKPDSGFVNVPVEFVNSNRSVAISHNWTIDGVKYTKRDVTHVFKNAGTYDVELSSENCKGVNSISRPIKIVSPKTPPVVDFVSDRSTYEIFETIQLTDLSSGGATYWSWMFVNPTTNDTIDGYDIAELRGGDRSVNKNPQLLTGNFFGTLPLGVWDVYLTASNVSGGVTVKKEKYVTVRKPGYNIGAETSLPANEIGEFAGTIYDDGGPTGNYGTNKTTEALIAPCGAQSVTLEFTSFDLLSNATLKIYDGVNALGTPLHTGDGFTQGNEPTGPITASSGALYLFWTSTTGTTSSGFAANWTSSLAGTVDAPVASYTYPSTTLYNGAAADFENTSLNAEKGTKFEWTLSGPENSSAATRDFSFTFLTNGVYTLDLKVIACDGRTSITREMFTVVLPNTPTNLDFVANTQRPSIGEEVTFTATSDKANNWEWTFFPNDGTNVTANAPSATTSNVRSFSFYTPGVYTVQCRAYNSLDEAATEATVVKTAYVIIASPCTPVIGLTTSEDVGINYVSITNSNTGDKFENTSESGVEFTGYTDYRDLGTISLNFGGTYNFEIKRNTNINAMNRKIWIDWNVDGDFDDVGELVATEASANTLSWMGSFTVPSIDQVFASPTRMRVGVSYGSDDNEPCGRSLTNINANRIGEFEDYSIQVVNDGDIPVITLIDADTLYIEQVATEADINYVSSGATANDPSQGDVTANVKISSDVDQTNPGVYYEVYSAMDGSGNEAEKVTRVVYVAWDQTAPVITVTGAADTTIEVGTAWVDLPAVAIDNKEGNISSSIVVSGEVDVDTLGDYTITYTIKDNYGNESSTTRIVRVVDTQIPVIDHPNADKSATCWTVEVQLQNIFADVTSASDNYNSIGDGLVFTANPAASNGGASVDTRFQGTTSVTYTATDESGNVATQCIDYVVRDYIPPVIDLRTLDVVTHRVNTPYTPVSASASDNIYDYTQISLTSTSNMDAYTLGTYQDTYTATDGAGNVSVRTRTVNVIDDIAPEIRGKVGGIVNLGVGSKVDAINFVNFSDNYDAPADLRLNHTLVFSNLNLQEAGSYSVIFKTEDNSGNMSREFTLYFDVDYDYQVLVNGISDLALEDMINVSPNPTNGPVNISVNLPENEEVSIAIFNTMGQQVAEVANGKVNNGRFSVNLQGNTNGMYYVKMSLNGATITKKIILNN